MDEGRGGKNKVNMGWIWFGVLGSNKREGINIEIIYYVMMIEVLK